MEGRKNIPRGILTGKIIFIVIGHLCPSKVTFKKKAVTNDIDKKGKTWYDVSTVVWDVFNVIGHMVFSTYTCVSGSVHVFLFSYVAFALSDMR